MPIFYFHLFTLAKALAKNTEGVASISFKLELPRPLFSFQLEAVSFQIQSVSFQLQAGTTPAVPVGLALVNTLQVELAYTLTAIGAAEAASLVVKAVGLLDILVYTQAIFVGNAGKEASVIVVKLATFLV